MEILRVVIISEIIAVKYRDIFPVEAFKSRMLI